MVAARDVWSRLGAEVRDLRRAFGAAQEKIATLRAAVDCGYQSGGAAGGRACETAAVGEVAHAPARTTYAQLAAGLEAPKHARASL